MPQWVTRALQELLLRFKSLSRTSIDPVELTKVLGGHGCGRGLSSVHAARELRRTRLQQLAAGCASTACFQRPHRPVPIRCGPTAKRSCRRNAQETCRRLLRAARSAQRRTARRRRHEFAPKWRGRKIWVPPQAACVRRSALCQSLRESKQTGRVNVSKRAKLAFLGALSLGAEDDLLPCRPTHTYRTHERCQRGRGAGRRGGPLDT